MNRTIRISALYQQRKSAPTIQGRGASEKEQLLVRRLLAGCAPRGDHRHQVVDVHLTGAVDVCPATAARAPLGDDFDEVVDAGDAVAVDVGWLARAQQGESAVVV